MWSLHIVVVPGEALLPHAFLFAVASCGMGWLYSYFTDEHQNDTALLCCLIIGAIGGWLGDGAGRLAGVDPLALVYGVYVGATMLGALALVCLAHDLAALKALPRQLRPPLTPAGGFFGLFLGFTAWPSASPLCEGTYGDGLRFCLTEQALYYEVRIGPFRGARRLALPCTVRIELGGGTLMLQPRDAVDEPIALDRVRCAGGVAVLAELLGGAH
jgi:hypothetical protein